MNEGVVDANNAKGRQRKKERLEDGVVKKERRTNNKALTFYGTSSINHLTTSPNLLYQIMLQFTF